MLIAKHVVKKWSKSGKNLKIKLGTAQDAKMILFQFQDLNFTFVKKTRNTGAHNATKTLK